MGSQRGGQRGPGGSSFFTMFDGGNPFEQFGGGRSNSGFHDFGGFGNFGSFSGRQGGKKGKKGGN